MIIDYQNGRDTSQMISFDVSKSQLVSIDTIVKRDSACEWSSFWDIKAERDVEHKDGRLEQQENLDSKSYRHDGSVNASRI